MAEISEQLTHPILGSLGWLPEYSHWFGQMNLPTGDRLDLLIDPNDGDRYEFLPRAAELFMWAIANEPAMLAAAINTYLLELYNDVWQQDDLPVLDAAGFAAQLKLDFLRIDASDLVPIEYGYDPGELFWGHLVNVEVDAALRYRGAHLIG